MVWITYWSKKVKVLNIIKGEQENKKKDFYLVESIHYSPIMGFRELSFRACFRVCENFRVFILLIQV